MSNVFYIDPIYIKYRKMWMNDRWKFSGEMVRLTIKGSKQKLTDEEENIINTMNRIVDEHDGKWIDDEPPKKMIKRVAPH